jgi:hypothetical protein
MSVISCLLSHNTRTSYNWKEIKYISLALTYDLNSEPLSPLCYMFSGEATNTNLWALTHDRCKHTNNYITNVFYYKYIIASYDKYAK